MSMFAWNCPSAKYKVNPPTAWPFNIIPCDFELWIKYASLISLFCAHFCRHTQAVLLNCFSWLANSLENDTKNRRGLKEITIIAASCIALIISVSYFVQGIVELFFWKMRPIPLHSTMYWFTRFSGAICVMQQIKPGTRSVHVLLYTSITCEISLTSIKCK